MSFLGWLEFFQCRRQNPEQILCNMEFNNSLFSQGTKNLCLARNNSIPMPCKRISRSRKNNLSFFAIQRKPSIYWPWATHFERGCFGVGCVGVVHVGWFFLGWGLGELVVSSMSWATTSIFAKLNKNLIMLIAKLVVFIDPLV